MFSRFWVDAYFHMAPSRTFHGPENVADVAEAPGGDNDPKVAIINFLQPEDNQDSIHFALNKVTPILINIEEENTLRSADRFSRVSDLGIREPVYPDVRVSLSVLFVCHFYDYTDALSYLGLIMKFFQSKPIWTAQNTPGLLSDIDKLNIELVTLPLAQQNEIWSGLRAPYHPSVLYRVKLLVFQSEPSVSGPAEIKGMETIPGDIE